MSRRRALVTGGASPIGAAISRALAAEGHAVLIHAHAGLDRAAALAAEIRAAGGEATAFACDLADMPATAAALEALLEAGPVQILVHNAGTHDDVPLAGMSEAQWRERGGCLAQRLLRRAAAADPADDRHPLGADHRHLLDLGAARATEGRRITRRPRRG